MPLWPALPYRTVYQCGDTTCMPLDLSPATAGESGIDGPHRAKPHTECAHTHSRLPSLTGRRGGNPERSERF